MDRADDARNCAGQPAVSAEMPMSNGHTAELDTLRASRRCLIFNFFGGVLQRGIPLYVQNLRVALEQQGIESREVRCPAMLRKLPRPLLNLLSVGCEQLVMPLLALAYGRTIYPSNSMSILGALSRRSALVVHDFIPNHKRNRRLSARYIRMTQRIFSLMRGDIIYISRSTEKIARRARCFPRSKTFFFPNAYYGFLALRSPGQSARGNHILLCSGWGLNKDLSGALGLYLYSGTYTRRPLQILGLSGRRDIVDSFCAQHPEVVGCITVLPRISDREVVHAYEAAAWVWVHSRSEGYGRSIAEARFCASRVVASNIGPFREQQDEFVFLYAGLAEFNAAVAACEASSPNASTRRPVEHGILQSEIRRYLGGRGHEDSTFD